MARGASLPAKGWGEDSLSTELCCLYQPLAHLVLLL